MIPFPRAVLRRSLAALGLAAVLVASPAGADAPSLDAPYPTNLSLLSEAADAAIQELFLDFTPRPGASVLIESASKHEAQWFVQDLLVARLMGMGFDVHLRNAEPAPRIEAGPASGLPEEAEDRPGPRRRAAEAGAAGETGGEPADLGQALAETDSTGVTAETDADGNPEGTLPPEGSGVAAPPSAETDFVFRFRVVECGLTYPKSYRKSPLGSRRVQRMALVNIHATLVTGERETVAWVGRGDAERADVVPSGKLSVLEGGSYPFSKPNLTTRGFGSYLEPALVTGIVVGLIYLFYTNQD